MIDSTFILLIYCLIGLCDKGLDIFQVEQSDIGICFIRILLVVGWSLRLCPADCNRVDMELNKRNGEIWVYTIHLISSFLEKYRHILCSSKFVFVI